MNYDFKTNWINVLPFLKTKKIQNAIKQSINKYLRASNINETYDKNKLPYHYCLRVTDYFCKLHDEDEKLEAELLEKGILQKDLNEPTGDDDDMDEYWESENAEKYREYKDNIMKPYIKDREEKMYQSYQCFGSCHWYNPTFGLTLAKMVLPNEEWVILTGEKHTTIANKAHTLLFDILYYREDETDFGGKRALQDSGRVISLQNLKRLWKN
jgi:hypothetical protein